MWIDQQSPLTPCYSCIHHCLLLSWKQESSHLHYIYIHLLSKTLLSKMTNKSGSESRALTVSLEQLGWRALLKGPAVTSFYHETGFESASKPKEAHAGPANAQPAEPSKWRMYHSWNTVFRCSTSDSGRSLNVSPSGVLWWCHVGQILWIQPMQSGRSWWKTY